LRLAGYEPGALTAELQGREPRTVARLEAVSASVNRTGMILPMHLAIGSILGLGESVSSAGQTLALVLTFVVIMGGVVNVLIGYIVGQVMVERKQNIARRRAYDAAHK
jgi:uncharacterized YccA/Bax inhibitor family protein